MKISYVAVVFVALLDGAGLVIGQSGQPTSTPSEFEAAVIRHLSPKDNTRPSLEGGPETSDPGQITWRGVPLQLLVESAFGLHDETLDGPPWLNVEKYSLVAKLARGTTPTGLQEMLRDLLRKRFGLVFHREMRSVPGYELGVAKSGCKLQLSAPEESAATNASPKTQLDAQGLPTLAAGQSGRLKLKLPNGGFRISARMDSLADIVGMCRAHLNATVVDKTGLSGHYDYDLDFDGSPELGPRAAAAQLGAEPSGLPDFAAAVELQLGLKLVRAKVQIAVLVVDHIEREPVEK